MTQTPSSLPTPRNIPGPFFLLPSTLTNVLLLLPPAGKYLLYTPRWTKWEAHHKIRHAKVMWCLSPNNPPPRLASEMMKAPREVVFCSLLQLLFRDPYWKTQKKPPLHSLCGDFLHGSPSIESDWEEVEEKTIKHRGRKKDLFIGPHKKMTVPGAIREKKRKEEMGSERWRIESSVRWGGM